MSDVSHRSRDFYLFLSKTYKVIENIKYNLNVCNFRLTWDYIYEILFSLMVGDSLPNLKITLILHRWLIFSSCNKELII